MGETVLDTTPVGAIEVMTETDGPVQISGRSRKKIAPGVAGGTGGV
jgi:hypothetical protein